MTPQEPGFTGVLLAVFFIEDMSRSVRFYRDACGFDVVSHHDDSLEKEVPGSSWGERTPWWVRLKAGTQEIALHENAGTFDCVGGTKHYFEVSDVDRQYARVVAAGAEASAIEDYPWMRLFSVVDPDGHSIYFQTPKPDWKPVASSD